ncbi:MAG: hypothetical protein H6831_13995 [Planctomycetes bacterium]|nr:hypothetical protein [Planctomycetota bacterium]MCB9905512.1 hypothetical protein [Planctomycetota bacterium]
MLIRCTILALLLVLPCCSTDTTEAGGGPEAEHPIAEVVTDEQAIADSFRALQDACIAHDGARAHELFAAATRAHWVYIKGLALNADKETLRRESMVVQLAVLVLRAKAGFETLESLDDVGMIQYALDNGLLGNQMILGNSLRDVEIDGDHAMSGARHAESGRDLEVRYGFAREGGKWRVDLQPTYAMANEIFAAKRAAHGVAEDEEEALYFLIGNATGTAGTEALWTPLSDLVGK